MARRGAGMAGIRMTQVPYKGATAAAAGLASGQTQVMFIAHSLALPFLPSGKVRPIAFAGAKRSVAFPDLPTVAEAGVPGYDYSFWIALFAPKGTPVAVLSKLRTESAKALPGLKERLDKSGLELSAVAGRRAARRDQGRPCALGAGGARGEYQG